MINLSQTKVKQKLMSHASFHFKFARTSLISCFGRGEISEFLS